MKWLLVQLTPWAEKTLNTADLAKELRRATQTHDIELYYPVIEDVVGKHKTAYSEYVFLEYRPEVQLHDLERCELFRGVLRDAKNNPQLVDDAEVARVRAQIEELQRYDIGERILVLHGSLKGNYGEVLSREESQLIIKVTLGDEMHEAAVPTLWVKRIGKRKR